MHRAQPVQQNLKNEMKQANHEKEMMTNEAVVLLLTHRIKSAAKNMMQVTDNRNQFFRTTDWPRKNLYRELHVTNKAYTVSSLNVKDVYKDWGIEIGIHHYDQQCT